jgi:hypothetical protein
MAWLFFRRIHILPGVTLNFSRSGVSVSLGFRAAHITFGPRSTTETVGLPGTGVYYTRRRKNAQKSVRTGLERFVQRQPQLALLRS